MRSIELVVHLVASQLHSLLLTNVCTNTLLVKHVMCLMSQYLMDGWMDELMDGWWIDGQLNNEWMYGSIAGQMNE